METNKGQVKVTIPAPEKSSRALALATLIFLVPKMILLIPHLIILYALGILIFVLTVFAQVVVLVSGKYPEQIHELVVGVIRWKTRVAAYVLGLRDEYPPFTLKD